MKKINGKLNFVVIIVLIILNVAFAAFYNISVGKFVYQAAYNDYLSLQSQNVSIVDQLKHQRSEEDWNRIIDAYQEHIRIYDKNGQIVAQTEDNKYSAFDAKVRTPFEYKGEVYLLRTSIYLLRDYMDDREGIVRFILIELMIIITALAIFVLIIYSFLLRPFRSVYRAIEEYDRSGAIMDIRLKGYAGRVYRRFSTMARKLDDQQMNQRRIIASISHDIKTPLTSIMGYSEQLKKDNLSEERKQRYLNTVYDKAVDIRTLVDEFDEYLGYNLNYGIKKSKLTVADIEKCITDDYYDDMCQAGISFEIINGADKDIEILADIQKLKRVCSNIFTNSIKHFKKDEKKIRLHITTEGEMVIFRFSDNGEGVPEDKLGLIFEPLYTSDEGRKVAGLGLAICREIVEVHDGRIYAEKSEMGGLSVCVELPRG